MKTAKTRAARCLRHRGVENPPPCHGCREARETLEALADEHMKEARAERERQQAAERAERAQAIAACHMCDTDGRLPNGFPCHHFAEARKVNAEGMALARNLLRGALATDGEA